MGEYDKLLLDKNSSSYKRRLAMKLLTLVLFVCIMAYGIYRLYPYAGLLRTGEGREQLKELVRENIFKGAVVFVTLQALQIVMGVIPPLQILGGVLFGILPGMLLSMTGLFLGSAIVFVLVKLIGYPLVQMMFSDKKISKIKFLNDDNNVVTVFALMFLIPGFPKDILTYLVPLTKISKRDFFLLILPARIPAIVMSAVVGGSIRSGHYILAAIFSAIVIILSALGIIFRKRIADRLHRLKYTKK